MILINAFNKGVYEITADKDNPEINVYIVRVRMATM